MRRTINVAAVASYGDPACSEQIYSAVCVTDPTKLLPLHHTMLLLYQFLCLQLVQISWHSGCRMVLLSATNLRLSSKKNGIKGLVISFDWQRV
jgi:hypothetical protein